MIQTNPIFTNPDFGFANLVIVAFGIVGLVAWLIAGIVSFIAWWDGNGQRKRRKII